MAEKIYTTEAFVVGERASGEGSKVLTLFTRELGLVYAYARSVRETRSKLRYNLSIYSRTLVSLVPGREYWRLVGAQDAENSSIAPRVCEFVCRFMGEHIPHGELFNYIKLGGEERELILAVLDHLGYVGVQAETYIEREKLIDRAVYASHL
ncbi:MAG: recombination protein O N-terminal domain-containing protein [Patescibacteria group bacterium]